MTVLTQPVLSSSATKALLVVIPGPVEVHRAVHPPLEHLGVIMTVKQEVFILKTTEL